MAETKQEVKHTALTAETDGEGYWWAEYRDKDGGGSFADCGDGLLSESRCREIVRAVNNFEGMLRALEEMVAWAERVNDASNEGGLLGHEYESAIATIRAAKQGR